MTQRVGWLHQSASENIDHRSKIYRSEDILVLLWHTCFALGTHEERVSGHVGALPSSFQLHLFPLGVTYTVLENTSAS